MKSIITTILNITGLLIYAGLTFAFGYFYGIQARHYPDPFKTVTEQMKSIQRQVGCVKIDGEIGTETTPLVNAKVNAEKETEERNLFNQYAIETMERMSKEKK